MGNAAAAALLTMWLLVGAAHCGDPFIFYDWNVSYITASPLGIKQQVIAINGQFPGPIVNLTTNWNAVVNVNNNLDEPLLIAWNGLQHRRNSWQDGVSGTNCPIPVGWNWTYQFQAKDQIGSFFYFPSLQFQRAAGGFGGVIVNNRPVIPVPFGTPDGDFTVFIGDWYTRSHKDLRKALDDGKDLGMPDGVLINGKGPYRYNSSVPADIEYETFNVQPGKTYRFRIHNVGIATSLNFRIQNHNMLLVETEGSYTVQQNYTNLDMHVGQSYSFLVTMDQNASSDYYIVASARFVNTTIWSNVTGVAILHYSNSNGRALGPLPDAPNDEYDKYFSLNQARSIRWNVSAGAARPNPQGSFKYGQINVTQVYVLKNKPPELVNGNRRCGLNGISYHAPPTPLKLADRYNLTGIFKIDFPDRPMNRPPKIDTSVGTNGGAWVVFPGAWTAILVSLDNVGMWNLRVENLDTWYLGQEVYVRVVNPEITNKTELPMPDNVLYCGALAHLQKPQKHAQNSEASGSSSLRAGAGIFMLFGGFVITWGVLLA